MVLIKKCVFSSSLIFRHGNFTSCILSDFAEIETYKGFRIVYGHGLKLLIG